MYEIYANLGWVYQHIDDYELALRSYTKALDIIYGKKKVRFGVLVYPYFFIIIAE